MANKTSAGLHTHDWTPACWGVLGRRGAPGALTKAREMMDGKPEPDHNPFGSDNHHLIQAMNNAAVFGDYHLARSFIEERVLSHGLGEGGPLYFGAGDVAPAFIILWCAERDKERDVARMYAKYITWVYLRVCIPLHIDHAPKRVISVLPSGEHEHPYNPTGRGHVFMPGSRALFGPPGGAGWYGENPLALIYQWMTDEKGRTLPTRYANYEIRGHENTWDCWAWLIATAYGMIPARKRRNAKVLKRAFRENQLSIHMPAAIDAKLRFGMDVVAFQDGSKIITASHRTAGPKPPVNWIEYQADTGDLRVCAPDGLVAYGAKGKGYLELSGDGLEIWAVASNPDREIHTRRYRTSDVILHRELPPKATRWRDGALHPQPVPEEPEPPEPEEPKEERKPWYERLWEWLEDLF